MITHKDIYAKILTTNNGKHLLSGFTKDEKLVLGEMRTLNLVTPATFMLTGDSVKIHPTVEKLVRGLR